MEKQGELRSGDGQEAPGCRDRGRLARACQQTLNGGGRPEQLAGTGTLGGDRPRGAEADFGQVEPEVQLGRRSDSDTHQRGSLRGDAGTHKDTRVAERQECSREGAPGESGSQAGRGEERTTPNS